MKITIRILLTLMAFVGALPAWALSLDTYAPASRLAQGRWVKISVEHTGMHQITAAQLRQWGFDDPAKVRIYGYGAQRIADVLSAENYIDDLPLVQSVVDGGAVKFYAVGPDSWASSNNGVVRIDYNIYTTKGYYFVTESDEPARDIEVQGLAQAMPQSATHYRARWHYEYDRVSPGEAGYLLVGESFKSQQSRKFTFDLPKGNIELECGIVSNASSASAVEFSVNGSKLGANPSDRLPVTAATPYQHGSYTTAYHTFEFDGGNCEVTVSVPAASAMKDCWLDYLTLNTQAEIALPKSGMLDFWAGAAAGISGATADMRLWDVTNPLSISQLRVTEGSKASWLNDYHGDRAYVAWTPQADMPTVGYEGAVRNQNVHGADLVDMVIFTFPEYAAQAERIAELHRQADHPLQVSILNLHEVYNEFASGAPDVSAMRKCLKMMYDRGLQGGDSATVVRYALIIGRATYDNRHLTSQFEGSGSHPTVPCWMGGDKRSQLSDNTAYGTDDFIAMLDDGSGSNMGLDDLCVAVGRIPARTVDEAKSAVDKLKQYVERSKTGTWKNSFLFLADDGDNGIHAKQADHMIRELLTTPGAQSFVSRVFVDAYDIVGGSCEGGRADMYRMLDEGVVWWNFTGHANNHSWTGENMLNYNDINNLYLTRVPVLMAATCDFLRWDSNTLSGGEILYHERYGGSIATISATRPVYISDNGYFTRAVGRSINKRDADGRLPRLGDIYRMAKNDILTDNGEHRSNYNRLRYVLMGDPAMQMALPHNVARLDSIDGVAVTLDNQVTLKALQRAVVSGSITDPSGRILDDFNGTVEISLYDAERSITTKGERENNVKYTFEQHGDKLYAGSAPVNNGRFSMSIAMPGEVADNFRPATMNIYASSTTSRAEAVGVNRDFYVFGYDESVPVDTVAPIIESFVLNSEKFRNGDAVNDSPMVIARVSDDVGVNLSSAGVGHQMTLTLDHNRTFTDVSLFYSPSTDGTPSGTISYPLENLQEGNHTLRLRIWDTAGNSAQAQIDFYVAQGLAPTIYELYSDANPAKTEANFYLRHDRPDSELSVTVTVYNLLGHALWQSTVKGRSDMFLSSPVTWNLCDSSGRRVPRGIYLYRATITADGGETYDTASRKIAVAAQ